MNAPKTVVVVAWAAFWIYWGVTALRSKRGTVSFDGLRLRLVLAVAVLLVVWLVHPERLVVHSVALEILGAAIVLGGLAFAVWARVHIGRNWGMPMTLKEEPELVTSGPYRFVRHPIYTGILVAVLGTGLAINLVALLIAAAVGVFFYYSATVEERNLGAAFPVAYPAYRARTKMLIPFVL